MLFRKLWRTMGLYKAQFISMVIMIALGIGVFIGFHMEWVSIEKNMSSFFADTGYADFRLVQESGFSEEDLQKILDIEGVEKAARYLAVTADVEERSGDSVALTVTTDILVSGFVVTEGEAYDAGSREGIWLSDKYAAANDIHVGDTLSFLYKSIEIKGEVKGLIKAGEYMICVRDESQLMPDHSTYGFAFISPVLYEEAAGFAFYPQINVVSDMEKKDFTAAAEEALAVTVMVLTKDETISYAEAEGEVSEGKTMGSVLPVLFLLIAVLTMVTTMHRLTAKEKTQIGTLKALGFKDRRILCHYTAYALMIGILGSAIGVALGYGIAYYIMNPDGMMGTYLDMPEWKLYLPWFCYVVLAAAIGLLTLIGFSSVRQMLKGTAADALRPYTPKKMKPMLIEKTKLFHRLSFGIRWNMRDSVRHKSRTAMSLIGIAGCMILIVGSLGMGDTMDAFLALYYDGATNYASRIYLAEEATKEQRNEVLSAYDGDWSASVSVQLEEKTVSLDIYSVEHDKVRFPDKDGGYVHIVDDGAYICMRLAEEFSLSVGDSFIISPYGSDEKYTLKVAGVIRSVSESIVITPKYADMLHISYAIDSVYTDVEKNEIDADSAIKNVSSKQMIMDSFDTFMDLMNTMIFILIAGALLLGVVVLYNLGVMSYTERYREMATLKVVGFKDRKIGSLLIGQNLWLSLIGVVIGMPAGMGVLAYLLKELAGEYEMKMAVSAATIAGSIVLTVGMSLLVSLMVSRKNKKIDMVEALKGAE
ncbi:MAG: FtsX-like permease family protein [Lachnospiraceae bacterium]|nr:FtsX-like permease family protein [Lachnospiraceae bacterium]